MTSGRDRLGSHCEERSHPREQCGEGEKTAGDYPSHERYSVIEFQIIENKHLGSIMNEFAALVEKGGVYSSSSIEGESGYRVVPDGRSKGTPPMITVPAQPAKGEGSKWWWWFFHVYRRPRWLVDCQ